MQEKIVLTRLANEEGPDGRFPMLVSLLFSIVGSLTVSLLFLYFYCTGLINHFDSIVAWAVVVLLILALAGIYLSLQVRRFYALVFAHNQRLNEALAENHRLEQQRQLAEERLKESEAHLRQASKMETVGRLAGGIVHDFNNILTAILGYSELAALKLGSSNLVHSYLEEITHAAERAGGLTSQLLAFSRKQILNPQVLNLNEVVASVEKLLNRLIREDIKLITYNASDLGLTMADPGQLEQVILNLALNARDAMPGGGTITIETSNTTLTEEYTGMLPGDYIQLTVSDTGTGMDQATLQKIFEPFFTTKETGKGTGLGLAMVYGIVQQNGGFLTVYSEPGRGTCFKIYLPRLATSGLPVVPAKLAQTGRHEQGTENILLVEDEASVRGLVAHILRGHGYNVTTASEGSKALALLPQLASPPDLLITDVIMPGMNGCDLVAHLQASQPGLKVLYLSGYTDHVMFDQGIVEPGLAFLQKPFTPAQLASQVRATLAAHNN